MRINHLHESLSIVYQDWSEYLINPRYVRRSNVIAWNDYDTETTKLPDIVTASDVASLYHYGQFSFQMAEDRALLQLYYIYDTRGKNILKATLAYYQFTPENEQFISNKQDKDILMEAAKQGDIALYRELLAEIMDYGKPIDTPVSWLRIDFAPEDARGVIHHDCHMHLSGFSKSRLVVMGVPTPQQFMEFIMALCYPHIYHKHRELDDTGAYPDQERIININTPSIPVANTSLSRCIAHLCIPSNQ